MMNPTALSVIGGADGPTTIFTTGLDRSMAIVLVSVLVVAAALTLAYFRRKH